MNEPKRLLNPPGMPYTKGQIERKPDKDSSAQLHHVSAKKLQEQRVKARALAKHQQIVERLAVSAQQMSSSVEEAQTAGGELQHALEQLALGAEQASSSCEESLQAITRIMHHVYAVSDFANASVNRSLIVQQMVSASSNDITRLLDGVSSSAAKSSESARLIAQLEAQAKEIGDIIAAVVNVADQTNLLALNAAIEAARAGEYGSGFAVVADEVRTLAEAAERSANDIKLVVEQVQRDVNEIARAIKAAESAAIKEMKNGEDVTRGLLTIEGKMEQYVQGAKETIMNLNLLRSGVDGFESGAKIIAQSAEEQASGVIHALRAMEEQVKALDEINQTTVELTEMSDELADAKDSAKAAEQLAATAEQLAAAIIEGTESAHQIMLSIEAIERNAEVQATATEQSAAAIHQLEAVLQKLKGLSDLTEKQLQEVHGLHETGKRQTEQLIGNIAASLDTIEVNFVSLLELEGKIRKIDKIVGTIDKVGIQTNMLAVNGAIEAAGAGKFGRGFAVVASDIRNLAQETALNAENIKDLVRDIQNQVMLVARDLQYAKEMTKTELSKARRITSESARIDSELGSLLQGAVNNHQSIYEVDTAVAETKRAVELIAATAMETAAASREAATSSKEQSMGIAELSRAIEDIAAMSDELVS